MRSIIKSNAQVNSYNATFVGEYFGRRLGQALLFTVMPFISDAFDTLKDVIFGGLCMVNEHVVIKVLGAFSWMWLLIVHLGLLGREDTLMPLVSTYLSVYMASFDVALVGTGSAESIRFPPRVDTSPSI